MSKYGEGSGINAEVKWIGDARSADDAFRQAMMEAGYKLTPVITSHGTAHPRIMRGETIMFGASCAALAVEQAVDGGRGSKF